MEATHLQSGCNAVQVNLTVDEGLAGGVFIGCQQMADDSQNLIQVSLRGRCPRHDLGCMGDLLRIEHKTPNVTMQK